MQISVRNDEPMWVRYYLTVEIPDDTPKDEIHDAAMDMVYAGEYEVESGPEPKDAIAGMDQEFTIES